MALPALIAVVVATFLVVVHGVILYLTYISVTKEGHSDTRHVST